jgi:hypothetical protein
MIELVAFFVLGKVAAIAFIALLIAKWLNE